MTDLATALKALLWTEGAFVIGQQNNGKYRVSNTKHYAISPDLETAIFDLYERHCND